MRVLVMVKGNDEIETGTTPPEDMEKMFAEMGKFNEELISAGVMKSGEGLHPSSKGKRILFDGSRRTVVDGPFAEAKELIAGFWIWEVKDMDEAVNWAKRCPNPTGVEGQLEIRPIQEMDDMGDSFTPELRAQEESQRARLEGQQ
jgi:hypothetical protein